MSKDRGEVVMLKYKSTSNHFATEDPAVSQGPITYKVSSQITDAFFVVKTIKNAPNTQKGREQYTKTAAAIGCCELVLPQTAGSMGLGTATHPAPCLLQPQKGDGKAALEKKE